MRAQRWGTGRRLVATMSLCCAAGLALGAVGPPSAATVTQPAVAQQDGIASALTLVGLSPGQAAELAAASASDPTGDTFRFAAEGSRPATLDLPYADIVGYGAARVAWEQPPDLACGGDVGGAPVVCGGERAALDGGVVLFWARFAGPVPLAPEFAGNLAFPTLTPGGVPWVANEAFAWDTFQGTDRWLQLVAEPGAPWTVLSQRWNGSEVTTTATDLFAVFAGDTVIAGVPLTELGLTPIDPTAQAAASAGPRTTLAAATATAQIVPFGFGVAIHLHDGSFGATPDDRSVVDSAPDTDGPTRRGPDDLAAPVADPVVVGTAPEPEPEVDEPGTATEPQDDDSTQPPTGDPAPTDEGGGVPWGPLVVVVLLTAGAGLFFAKRRTPAATPCTCSLSLTIEGPAQLRVCCMRLAASLRPVQRDPEEDADGYVTDGERRSDPARRHLDLDVDGETGWDLSDHLLVAQPQPSCSGGGSIDVDAIAYEWTLTPADDALTIEVEATAPVNCPHGGEHPHVQATAVHRIALTEHRCRISVLLEQNTWSEKPYNHADVMIECGEYREIFGWFPRGEGTELFTGSKAYVSRWRGSAAAVDPQFGLTSIRDEIGDDRLITYRGHKKTKRWVIEPDDCSVCVALRRWWMEAHGRVGGITDPATDSDMEYSLLGQNCVYMVWRSLQDSGALPEPTLPEWATRPVVGGDLEHIMDRAADDPAAGATYHAGEVLP